MIRPSSAHHRARRERGLTLVELMVAMVILSIGLISLLTMQIETMKSGRIGRHVTDAGRVAQDQMEVLQNQSWILSAPTAPNDGCPVAHPRFTSRPLASTMMVFPSGKVNLST